MTASSFRCRSRWACSSIPRSASATASRCRPGRAAWVHEFEPDRSVKPSFQAAPGTSFVIQGTSAAEDAVAVNAGLKMNWSSNTSMFAAFDGKFGDGLQSYGGDVGLKVNW
ncbi:autotransporter domain-containing protein [Mesorhizobium sp. B3-1-3]|nr:autotransporter domain-containing protein [Mesorhizobium sp. B3-1-8]TPI67802.1 autotransporter domain-containing protein [Mesorhizobium sp. B3-1-3]